MRLLIVDDGQYIVTYLKHLLDWNKIGIDYVQTTTNPLEAKQILESTPIDILLTDIRMPEVSGVDLLKLIHEHQSSCRVIFLSGYSDFEYTQSAIRFGAIDYLLKPVDKDEMEKAIIRAVYAVKKARTTSIMEWSDLDGIGLLLAILGDNSLLEERLSLFLSNLSSESFMFIKILNHSEETENILQNAAGILNRLVWFVGGSSPWMMAMLPASSILELSAKDGGFLFSEPFLLHEKNTARSEFMRLYYGEKVSLGDSIFLRNMHKKWILDMEDWESQIKVIQKMFLDCQSKIRQFLFLIEFISRLYAVFPKLKADQVADWVFQLQEESEPIFTEILSALLQLDRNAQQPSLDIVDAIQSYVVNHLKNPLNLKEIGKLVHLHPVYLSKYYKQVTGENLSNFLLDKRMKKAANLLKETTLQILDISQMVGYKKPQYFIKLFKEQYGVTPSQYRRTNLK